jgi:hypothetical protein
MNENMSEYKDLINLMEATPKAPVPDRFTQNVMGRVAERDQGAWAKLKQALFNPSGAGVQSRWAQTLSVSNPRECSFCFFITGFFYLIMGIVLIAGFKAIGYGMAAKDWITLQPYLTIGAAMWLLFLGALLIMDGRAAVKIAQYGTLLYIFFTVVNGILMRSYLHVPYTGILLIGFVATSALMGVMLAFAVHKMELRTE